MSSGALTLRHSSYSTERLTADSAALYIPLYLTPAPVPDAKRPKRGSLLDFDALRDECARVIAEDGRTLAGIAAAVVEAVPERDGLTRSAVSNAKNATGAGVAKLQTDIIATLTGASLSGPYWRAD